MSGGVAGRRIAYYLLLIGAAIAVHQSYIVDVMGSGAADFLRRNSEAYALMVLIPLYWDLFGWAAWSDSTVAAPRRPGWWYEPRWLGWLGLLVLCAVATQSELLEELGIGLSQSVVTLGEAFVAAVVISLYTAWSRAIPSWEYAGHGAPGEPWSRRTVYYVAGAAVSVLAYQSFAATVLSAPVVDWLILNVEALSALLIVPAYFDLVARPEAPAWVRLVWYPSLLLIPLLNQTGTWDGALPAGLVDWLGRSTEAFIAAVAISAYFDVWRGIVHDEGASVGAEMAEDVG